MAARLNPKNDVRTRSAIQTTQLVKRLQGFAFGQKDKQSRKPIAMTSDQVKAALGLLKKTLPDLATLTHQGDEDRPLQATMEIVLVKPSD